MWYGPHAMERQLAFRACLRTDARYPVLVSIRLWRKRSTQLADRNPHRRRQTATLQPAGAEIVQLPQIAFGGRGVVRHAPAVVKD